MSLLSVVQDVCQAVGVMQVTSVFSNLPASRTQQEMLALANEMAQRIAYDTRDWRTLTQTMTLTGDGKKASFPLPGNYQRMLTDPEIYRSSTPQVPLMQITDVNEWVRRQLQNYWYAQGQWIILADQIYIQPLLAKDEIAVFPYLDNRIIELASGGLGSTFQSDTDGYVLKERLLKLGMIWQWKANKGSPYAEDMGTFSDALAMLSGHDQPAPIFIDAAPMSSQVNAGIAYPWPVPTP